MFEKGLYNADFFRNRLRPFAYRMANGDAEKVHELALNMLTRYEDVLKVYGEGLDSPEIKIRIGNYEVIPFGTAAGLDKNGDALKPLSHIFGFMVPGTVVVNPRMGNPRPRVIAQNNTIYNAQGFPSKGLDYFLGNIRRYREDGYETPVIVSICGIPEPDIETGYDELKKLVKELDEYADGFIWNPYSPNTESLKQLRKKDNFKRAAETIAEISGDKPKLVKLGPYDHDKNHWIDRCGAWLEGGGDGFAALNTMMISRDKVPSVEWGYPTAGMSGECLKECRRNAIVTLRDEFPGSIIFSTGGIDSAREAEEEFTYGATALKGYTPYVFNGFGLLQELVSGAREVVKTTGLNLAEYQDSRRNSPGRIRTAVTGYPLSYDS